MGADWDEYYRGLKNNRDMVNHPPHYISSYGLEVINVIEAFTANLKGIEATDTGNVIKYICRWKNKNGVEDLKKARWYIDHLIAHLEGTAEDGDPNKDIVLTKGERNEVKSESND